MVILLQVISSHHIRFFKFQCFFFWNRGIYYNYLHVLLFCRACIHNGGVWKMWRVQLWRGGTRNHDGKPSRRLPFIIRKSPVHSQNNAEWTTRYTPPAPNKTARTWHYSCFEAIICVFVHEPPISAIYEYFISGDLKSSKDIVSKFYLYHVSWTIMLILIVI